MSVDREEMGANAVQGTRVQQKETVKNVMFIKEQTTGGWRDGSVVKSTGCSSRGIWFSSQHPHGSSQFQGI